MPCIFVHSVFNGLSAFAKESIMTPKRQIVSGVLLALIAVAAVLFFTVYLPNTPDNLFLQAQNLVAEGKTEQARTIYEKVLQADHTYMRGPPVFILQINV